LVAARFIAADRFAPIPVGADAEAIRYRFDAAAPEGETMDRIVATPPAACGEEQPLTVG